jgi:hypothetical protein
VTKPSLSKMGSGLRAPGQQERRATMCQDFILLMPPNCFLSETSPLEARGVPPSPSTLRLRSGLRAGAQRRSATCAALEPGARSQLVQ